MIIDVYPTYTESNIIEVQLDVWQCDE